ncbi:MAG TPA: DUF4136 domain-containing protein [Phycisphaerales bacterium]|nr:DUF4136 domain-containing protein [Phycisphaerales bacterium]
MPRLLLLLSLALLMAGCSSVRVTQDYEKTADFASYQAFAWSEPRHVETGDPRLDDPLLHARIQRAIETELTARGYRFVPAAEADLLVRYHALVQGRIETSRSSVALGTGYWWRRAGVGVAMDYPYGSREYDEGSLLIDFLSPASGELVWRGTGVRSVEDTPSSEERDRVVADVVKRVLDQYPPRK